MSEEPTAVVRRFIEEIWHQGHLEAIEEVIAPNYVRHTSHYREGGHAVHGPEGAQASDCRVSCGVP